MTEKWKIVIKDMDPLDVIIGPYESKEAAQKDISQDAESHTLLAVPEAAVFIKDRKQWFVPCESQADVDTNEKENAPDERKKQRISRSQNLKFKECSTCSSKTGSPPLCPSCLHNRHVIEKLQTEIDKLNHFAEPPEPEPELEPFGRNGKLLPTEKECYRTFVRQHKAGRYPKNKVDVAIRLFTSQPVEVAFFLRDHEGFDIHRATNCWNPILYGEDFFLTIDGLYLDLDKTKK